MEISVVLFAMKAVVRFLAVLQKGRNPKVIQAG